MRSKVSAFLSLFLLAASAAPALAQQKYPAVLRIGAIGQFARGHAVSTGLIAVAQSRGFLQKAFAGTPTKLDVKIFTSGGLGINEAMATGNIDIAESGGLTTVIGRAGRLPVRLIMGSGARSNSYLAVRNSPETANIRSVKDIRGRRITTHLGASPHLGMVRILDSAGVSEKDVRVINLELVDEIAALNAGSVDGIVGSISVLELRDKGRVRIIGTTKGLPAISGSLGATIVLDRFAREYPDAARRFVRALVEAAAWASQPENRADVIAIFASTGIAAKYYDEDMEGPLKPRFVPLLDGAFLKGFDAATRFAVNERLIRKEPDIRGAVDPQFLNAALKDLKLEGYWKPVP